VGLTHPPTFEVHNTRCMAVHSARQALRQGRARSQEGEHAGGRACTSWAPILQALRRPTLQARLAQDVLSTPQPSQGRKAPVCKTHPVQDPPCPIPLSHSHPSLPPTLRVCELPGPPAYVSPSTGVSGRPLIAMSGATCWTEGSDETLLGVSTCALSYSLSYSPPSPPPGPPIPRTYSIGAPDLPTHLQHRRRRLAQVRHPLDQLAKHAAQRPDV